MADEQAKASPVDVLRERLTEQDERRAAVVQFRPGDLADDLSSRGTSLGGVAKRDLERYYGLLRTCLADVRDLLSVWEARLVVEALRERKYDVATARFIWAFVDDAVEQGRDYGVRIALKEAAATGQPVDVPELVRKLRTLDECQALAVYDAVERYARLPRPEQQDHERALGRVGLAIDPDDLPF